MPYDGRVLPLVLWFLWLGASAQAESPLAGPVASLSPSPSPLPLPSSVAAAEPPSIASLVSAPLLKRAVEGREVLCSARIESLPGAGPGGELKSYRYWALVRVNAPVSRTREVLTDFPLYARLVPFVSRAQYSAAGRTLDLEGGVLGWKLHSVLLFEEPGPREIRFRVVAGAFTGMTGRAIFESLGEKGTLVHLSGVTRAREFPPALIMERGAEIVFGFTGKRMRSYIEDPETQAGPSAGGRTHDPEIPRPRRGGSQPRF